jgi:hypothetical protein
MRLVENHRVARGQQLGNAFVTQRHVGKKQMVIHHHHVGIQRLLARAHHKTFVVMLAVGAEAVVARGGDMRPDAGVFRHLGEIGPVAALRAPSETRDQLQVARVLARGQQPAGLRILKMVMAHIIGAPFQQRHRHRRL